MEQKYVIGLKIMISVMNLNNLKTHIFLFSILISFLVAHSVDLIQSKI